MTRRTLDALLDTYGTTYATEAGIPLRDKPQPLYQLLVLSHLLSARIRASVAVAAARALFAHGIRNPRRMADATWQQRVDALGEGGYRRYDERTATQLGDGAGLLIDEYGGDLRRLRREADGDTETLGAGLRRMPGVGPAGADIFLREVQAVWPETAPYLDAKALQGAERLGLPTTPAGLARLGRGQDPAVLAAALVRAALDKDAAKTIGAAASGSR
ncbi:endonuclease [Streptomyces hypolithicus]